MARANVYLPDDLHERARAAGLNVSELTQRAIERELHRRERLAAMDALLDELLQETGPATDDERAEADEWARAIVNAAARAARGDKGGTTRKARA